MHNITFCLWCTFFTDDKEVSLFFGFLALLFALFAITVIRFLKVTNEIEMETAGNDHCVRKEIENEYKRIHMLRKRKELLMKAGCLDPKENENIVFDIDDAGVGSGNKPKEAHEVRFNYLEKYGSYTLEEEKRRRHPPG